jgi:SAM-dependent methyltransferase
MTAELDPDARRMARFFQVFESLPRGGPGDPESTRRALAMITDLPAQPRVLDLGCGPGAGSSNLANLTGGRVTALDLHTPFVVQQASAARAAGLSHRLDPVCADMRALPFAPGAFDLVWSEGAVYVVGFEAGLREWRPLLAPGGHVAVSEVCWTRPSPPPECAAFWEQEYPAIRDVADRLAAMAACGYDTVGHFTLPAASWWDDYYRPLEAKLARFRERHRGEDDAESLADQVGREIDVWRRFSAWYGYEFFVARAR